MSPSHCLTSQTATPLPPPSAFKIQGTLPHNKAHFPVSLEAITTPKVLVDTQSQGDLREP